MPLPIVTKHEPGLPFPPRNLRIKFGANSSTIFLVIVITDKQTHTLTDKQTNASKTYWLAFAGRIMQLKTSGKPVMYSPLVIHIEHIYTFTLIWSGYGSCCVSNDGYSINGPSLLQWIVKPRRIQCSVSIKTGSININRRQFSAK